MSIWNQSDCGVAMFSHCLSLLFSNFFFFLTRGILDDSVYLPQQTNKQQTKPVVLILGSGNCLKQQKWEYKAIWLHYRYLYTEVYLLWEQIHKSLLATRNKAVSVGNGCEGTFISWNRCAVWGPSPRCWELASFSWELLGVLFRFHQLLLVWKAV